MTDRLRTEILTACRSLLATPVPVAAAILTLAVAAGVNLAMFGLIGRALLNPPAGVSEPERVFTLGFNRTEDPAGAASMTTTSYVTFADIRDRVPAIGAAAGFERDATSAVVDGDQRRVNAMLVTGAYFDLLGARPLLGRGISPAEDSAGVAEPIAVLSDGFWRSAFGGDRGVVGRRLSVAGLDYTVAGVMPESFSGHSATDVDLWVPISAAMRNSPGWDREAYRNILSVIVRLAPGGSRAAVEAQAGSATGRRVALSAIVGADVGAAEQRVAWWLTGVSLLVLAIGLANAGTLLVARASKRRWDFSIRAALGASRGRLMTQAFTEAAVLAAAATAASLALAPWLDDAVRRVLFPGVVAGGGSGVATFWAAAVAGVLSAIVAGAANLWQMPSKTDPWRLSAAGRTGGRRARTITGLLLVQTTLSVLLLAGAAMFGRSLYNLAAQDFGMRMDGVVLVDFEPGPGNLAGQAEVLSNAIDRIRAMPGVQMITAIDAIPFGGFNVPPISVPGRAEPPNVGGQLPRLTAATPEYLTILGVQVVEGRAFTAADDRGAPVVIVNQAMARGVWPGESALGKCIRIGFDPDFDPATATGPPTPSEALPCRAVVGVTRDVRQRSLLPVDNEARLMEYYVPFSQVPKPPFAGAEGPPVRGFLLRAGLGADVLAGPIRRLVVGQRTDLPYLRVQPYARLLDRQMRPWTLATTLLVWFSALALGVAAVGLYAAFAHAVGERRREMAIRLAIGARPGRVLTMVLREALVLAGAGVACGWVAAAVAGHWVQSLLFGTTASDPIVLASAAGVMLAVAASATILPARAASRVDPNVLLKAE